MKYLIFKLRGNGAPWLILCLLLSGCARQTLTNSDSEVLRCLFQEYGPAILPTEINLIKAAKLGDVTLDGETYAVHGATYLWSSSATGSPHGSSKIVLVDENDKCVGLANVYVDPDWEGSWAESDRIVLSHQRGHITIQLSDGPSFVQTGSYDEVGVFHYLNEPKPSKAETLP